MRADIVAHSNAGGAGLDPLVRKAVELLGACQMIGVVLAGGASSRFGRFTQGSDPGWQAGPWRSASRTFSRNCALK